MSRTANILAFAAAAGFMLTAAAEASAQARTRADPTIRYEFLDGTFARDKPTFWYRPIAPAPDPAYAPAYTPAYTPVSSDAYAPTSSGVYTPVYSAPTASTYASDVSATVIEPSVVVISNAPVPDTPRNRARYGGPNSRGGQMTAPLGN